jgi:hypothetical protein
VEPGSGLPPQEYLITYRVKTLRWDVQSNRPLVIGLNRLHIQLPLGYPRENPRGVMQTPVFHPNFGNWVCMSDAWGPSQTLVDLVYQVGEMLQFRSYNLTSPMNAEAARWVKENQGLLPLDNIDLAQLKATGEGA